MFCITNLNSFGLFDYHGLEYWIIGFPYSPPLPWWTTYMQVYFHNQHTLVNEYGLIFIYGLFFGGEVCIFFCKTMAGGGGAFIFSLVFKEAFIFSWQFCKIFLTFLPGHKECMVAQSLFWCKCIEKLLIYNICHHQYLCWVT